MKKNHDQPANSTELRRCAEERLKRQRQEGGGQKTEVETARLVHELQVHEIELEMQNEELQKARNDVEALLARYTDLYEFAPIGYLTLDREGVIRQVNLSGSRMLAAERSRLVNRRLGLLVAEGDRRVFSDFLQKVFASETREFCEVTLPQAGPQPHIVRIEGTRSADGQECRAVVLDITDRRHAEEAVRQSEVELREKDRRKTEFLAMLSHELRNPLAAITTSLPILEQADPGSEVSRQTRAILDRQVALMNRLLGDLLDVSRIKRGKVHLEGVKRLDLNGLVEQEVKDYRAVFKERGIGLEWIPASNPLWTDGDAARLSQVVENLLNNAAKFTPVGGKVTVATLEDAPANRAVIRVKDTGVGILPDLLGQLFEPFMQAPQPLDRSQGGLGLGLSLVKGIAELHGGGVEVRSDGIGKGTEFFVYLPIRKEVVAKPSAPEKAPFRKRRILIIEDHDDTALLLRWALEMRHHEVEVASDGPDGLLKARQFRPDVVLCDIGLPGMDGYEVAKAMRADPDLNRIKLIALSGYAQPEDVTKAREAGFDRHLAKPSTPEEIDRAMVEPQ